MIFFLAAAATQLPIPRVGLLPDFPARYELRDWQKTAHIYDDTVFDLSSKGPYLPLTWSVPHAPNLDRPGFGVPSYVGSEELRGKAGESLASMGSLLGATAVGINKSKWVELTPEYYNPKEKLVLNNAGGKSGDSFWYELLPSIVFTQLSSRYSSWARGRKISDGIADAWSSATTSLDGNFDHTSFDFTAKKAIDNKMWKEPDSAAAVAYLELAAYLRTQNSKYLGSARKALTSLQKRDDNPTYEILTAYGVQAAAYLNANKGDSWDVPRFISWPFDPTSPNRVGWGMVAGKWGGYDAGGLMGSTTDGGGYAFAMNTFLNAATLGPVARYDDRFSAAIAKWLLNLSSAARLFYKDVLPKDHQSGSEWPGDPQAGIAYEALRRTWDEKSPYAAGDAKRSNWAKEDFGLYGGGYVGLLAALVHPTDVPGILRIDLRATDFLSSPGYPTDLLWNPFDAAKTVSFDLGSRRVRPYDPLSHQFLTPHPMSGILKLRLGAKQAIQIVKVPALGALVTNQNRTLVDEIPIDFNNGKVPLPPPKRRIRRDASVLISVSRAVNGSLNWSKSAPISLNGGEGSSMKADLRFGWDEKYLYFRIEQKAPATQTIEAPSPNELAKHRWDFEQVLLDFNPSRETFPETSVPEITLGWSSTGRSDLVHSDNMPDRNIQVVTAGTAGAANRTIEGKVSWADLYQAFGTKEPLTKIVRSGSKIGCQPLLTDGTFRRQAYIGGARYSEPTGFDANSRTLVLQ